VVVVVVVVEDSDHLFLSTPFLKNE